MAAIHDFDRRWIFLAVGLLVQQAAQLAQPTAAPERAPEPALGEAAPPQAVQPFFLLVLLALVLAR